MHATSSHRALYSPTCRLLSGRTPTGVRRSLLCPEGPREPVTSTLSFPSSVLWEACVALYTPANRGVQETPSRASCRDTFSPCQNATQHKPFQASPPFPEEQFFKTRPPVLAGFCFLTKNLKNPPKHKPESSMPVAPAVTAPQSPSSPRPPGPGTLQAQAAEPGSGLRHTGALQPPRFPGLGKAERLCFTLRIGGVFLRGADTERAPANSMPTLGSQGPDAGLTKTARRLS